MQTCTTTCVQGEIVRVHEHVQSIHTYANMWTSAGLIKGVHVRTVLGGASMYTGVRGRKVYARVARVCGWMCQCVQRIQVSAEVCRYLGAHMCVQMCMIMFRCVQDCEVCADVHRYADVCTYVKVCVSICTNVQLYAQVCGYVWMYAGVCRSVYSYVDVCGCVQVYTGVCTGVLVCVVV